MTTCITNYKGRSVNCRQLLLDFNGLCPLCLRQTPCDDWLIAHHVHPERGGEHELSNLFVCCKYCKWECGWEPADEVVEARHDYYGAAGPNATGFWKTKQNRELAKLCEYMPAGWEIAKG